MEVSRALSDLYPELVEAGGLAAVVQRHFEENGSQLRVQDTATDLPFAYARVEHEGRSSQLCIAAKHRAFCADFWDRGVQYGDGWAATLDEAVEAIGLFLVRRATAAELGRSFPWVGILGQAAFHEAGPGSYVDHAWDTLLDWLKKEPVDSVMGKLLPLALACADRPRLRRLMPYTSHDTFCISRRTSCGYEPECAGQPIGPSRFRTWLAGSPVEGDAKHVATTMESSLPPDCPAAAFDD